MEWEILEVFQSLFSWILTGLTIGERRHGWISILIFLDFNWKRICHRWSASERFQSLFSWILTGRQRAGAHEKRIVSILVFLDFNLSYHCPATIDARFQSLFSWILTPKRLVVLSLSLDNIQSLFSWILTYHTSHSPLAIFSISILVFLDFNLTSLSSALVKAFSFQSLFSWILTNWLNTYKIYLMLYFNPCFLGF